MVPSDCAKTILLYLLAALEDDMYCTVDSCKKMHYSIGTFILVCLKNLFFPRKQTGHFLSKLQKKKPSSFQSEI